MGLRDEAMDVLKGKRVVIVEDEGITVMYLRSILNAAGMKVVGEAFNANDAIRVILEAAPDIVLMDITMPGELNGLDATETVLRSARICVIVLSAYSTEEYVSRAKQIGAAGYIIKPIVESTLISRVWDAYVQWAS